MSIKIDDGGITSELEKICHDLGIEKRRFNPHSKAPTEAFVEPKDWDALLHDCGLLIVDKQPTFVYIRDHSYQEKSYETPEERRRIHFTVCKTLCEMKEAERLRSRYFRTNRDNDKYLIDVRGQEKEESLYPCRLCLAAVNYRCFALATRWDQMRIVKSFRAKEALDLLEQQFQIFEQKIASEDIRSEMTPTDYSEQWARISWEFRKGKNFTCEECGDSFDPCRMDTHHKDGDKRNNAEDNLECLCKPCHGKRHRHYRTEFEPA